MWKRAGLATCLVLSSSVAFAEIFVTAVNNDSADFFLTDLDTQVTIYSPAPDSVIAARSTDTFVGVPLLSNVEVVDVTYESDRSFVDECHFRYVTISGFPQSPIADSSGSARCSARVTAFDFVTGDAYVTFTMDN